MATNAQKDGYKLFKFYEGLCSSKDFPKEISKVLALGVKSKAQKDLDGKILVESQILKANNWDIVYPAPDDAILESVTDHKNISPSIYKAKILNQIDKITDTVILKTTTTEKDVVDTGIDDLTVDESSNSASRTMYLEIYKPTYIANPESYPLDCERHGIVPQLITKEMLENSFKTIIGTEDAIYLRLKEAGKATVKEDNRPLSGEAIRISDKDYDKFVLQLSSLGYSVSLTGIGSQSVNITGADIAKIKQENAVLYDYILNNIETGGIEPKVYNRLSKITFTFYKAKDGTGITAEEFYSLKVSGLVPYIEYTIPKGTQYTLSHMPNGNVVPEFFTNGVYVPLETKKYNVQNNVITFDENIVFDTQEDGILVVRYEYSKKTDGIISERTTMVNNHYVLMRMFDNINEKNNGPAENVYSASGDAIQINSHISPWSKLSWYRDFEEVLKDTIDEDISQNSVQDGTYFVPLETPGLNADTKMRYWINTNNDRFSLIVMGNPSLDYSTDRHLISACYCGAIDSFDHSINDTAGNFALFTSSSTEPCNTVLSAQKENAEIPHFVFSQGDKYTEHKEDIDMFKEKCIAHFPYKPGQEYYSIQTDAKTYLNKKKICRYMILDAENNVMTDLKVRKATEGWGGENGKYDSVKFYIEDVDVNNAALTNGNYEIYFLFHYYTEKTMITSGVSRDIFGNVLNTDKINSYGSNTSDGVTSVMMFHTRSKAYYQKHHMLFATTEEYMSKVMYGKSSYTGEYYADRIKITHGNDGPRGTLSDLLVIDSSSLYALDELVINKDFAKDPNEYEETFVFFPITAPYSPLSDSPNARYGLAIKKQEVEPNYADEMIILRKAKDEITKIARSLWMPTDKTIYPPDRTDNGCSVYWKVLPETAWMETESNNVDYVPLKLVVSNSSKYKGNLENPINADSGASIAKGSKVSDGTTSYVAISGFEPSSGEKLYYGISDAPIEKLGGLMKNKENTQDIPESAAQLKVTLFDEAQDDDAEDKAGGWTYGIDGVPYTGEVVKSGADTVILDAAPDKYLILYSAKDNSSNGKCTISKFASLSLKGTSDDNELLQYPVTFEATVVTGIGTFIDNTDEKAGNLARKKWVVPYGESKLNIKLMPGTDFKGKPEVKKTTDGKKFDDVEVTGSAQAGWAVNVTDVKNGTQFNITFVKQ